MPACRSTSPCLFSREQYLAAAEAFLRGIERRIDAGLNPNVGSVASVFISRWDAAVAGKVPDGAAQPARHRHRQAHVQGVPRAARLARAGSASYNAGARPQRLLWASTGTKDPKASDVLYVKALAAPFTVNTMPEGTLKALADHGEIGTILPADGGDCEEVLAQFAKAGIDVDALAAQLQDEGAKSFVKSWNDLHGGDRVQERRPQEGQWQASRVTMPARLRSDIREHESISDEMLTYARHTRAVVASQMHIEGGGMMRPETDPLSTDELRKMDAYWRAANYLSVGQIYLYDNPLLKEPLAARARQAAPARPLGDDAGSELPLRAPEPRHQEARPRT